MAVYQISHEGQVGDIKRLLEAEALSVVLKVAGDEVAFPYRSKPMLIQICSDRDTFVIEAAKVDVAAALKELMASEKVLKIFKRAKNPVKQFLHHYGIETRHLFCCGLASRLAAMGNRGEKQRLSQRLQPLRDQQAGLDQMLFDSNQLGPDYLQVALEEGRLVLQVYRILAKCLNHHKLKRVSSLEFRTVLPVAAMELRGIYADKSMLAEAKASLEADMDSLQTGLLEELQSPERDMFGNAPDLNLKSPEKVKEALNARGIPVSDTSESRLRPFVKDYPFIGQLLEYRHVSRLHGSVTSQLIQAIAPETGRIHSTYHQIASPSGRFACSDPNIQQIPRESLVRSCIRPEPGYRFIVADYSQVELRVAAGISEDRLMLKAYGEGGDLHRLTAGLTMGKPVEEVTKQERQAAKAINFGLIYAMGPRGLQQSAQSSYGVAMTFEEAKTFRQRYFENYRGIHRWQKQTEKFGRDHGYVRTAAGRIRSYKQEPLRVAELLNIPIQGTAAEGLKSALCIFWDRVQQADVDASIVAIIHDEIIVEVREDQVERTQKILESSMVDGLKWLVKNVPFQVDMVAAESWAEK